MSAARRTAAGKSTARKVAARGATATDEEDEFDAFAEPLFDHEFLGQDTEWERMLTRARQRTMPHSLLLTAPAGAGKTTAARLLAAALLCESPASTTDASSKPCGSCRGCVRVRHANHPDLHVLAPPPDKRDIPVDSVRGLQDVLTRTAVEGGARVVVVDPADRLNEQGQNALLKTLEEPGDRTVLLLATSKPESLLETVRSRAPRLRILPLAGSALAEAATVLQQARLGRGIGGAATDSSTFQRALRWASGSVGRVLWFAGAEASTLQDVVAECAAGSKRLGPVPTARALLAQASGRAEVAQRGRLVLALLAAACREDFSTVAGGEPRSYGSQHTDPWTSRLDALIQAERDLLLQIPAEAVFIELALRLSKCPVQALA